MANDISGFDSDFDVDHDDTSSEVDTLDSAELDINVDDDAEQSNTVTAFNKYFDREVTFQRPDEISFTFFQQDMNSHEMSQTEKMGAMGDYIRTLMPEAEYREFRRRSIEDARRLGDKAAAHFYRVMNYMLEFFLDHIVESDQQALKKETSRAERRAAEKARRRQAKKK